MHLAKSIRVFRTSPLHRYTLPPFPSISSSLSHFSLTLRGLLITSLISVSGFLWGAIWPRWCVHEGVRLCVIMGMCVFTCARVFLSGCLSRQMLHLTFQHDSAEVELWAIQPLNLQMCALRNCLVSRRGWKISMLTYLWDFVNGVRCIKMQLSYCVTSQHSLHRNAQNFLHGPLLSFCPILQCQPHVHIAH